MKHKRKTIDRAEAIELAHEAIKEMDFTDITDVVWDLVEGAESINDITCTGTAYENVLKTKKSLTDFKG